MPILPLFSNYRVFAEILAIIPAIMRGKQGNWPGVLILSAEEIEIHTRRPYPINTDGEIITYTAAKFQVIPEALSVIVPLG